MKAMIALTLLLPLNAFAVTNRTGCGLKSVQYAKETLEKLNADFEGGRANQVDVLTAKIHLADTRYCAGDQYSTSEYCQEKSALIEELVDMRTIMVGSGSVLTYAVDDTKAEFAQFKTFCATHKGQD